MANATSQLSIPHLVLVPTLLTLAVTLLRLAGELRSWPGPWFNKDSGLVGITMLPPIFGFYFALKLWRGGERTDSVGHAFELGLLGVVLNQGVEATVFSLLHTSIFSQLLILWTAAIISALLQYLAWPALFKALTLYGLGARVPTVIISFFALRGHWGTHFDFHPGPLKLTFWPLFWWFYFFEEMIYWVSFTVVTGTLAGSVAAAVAKHRMQEPQGGA